MPQTTSRCPIARCPLTPTCSLMTSSNCVCPCVRPGELLRKKRREKDGHKDPLLCEISALQESVMRQISELRLEHEAAERKRSEIDKVALILGLDPSDRPRRPAPPPGPAPRASRQGSADEKVRTEVRRSGHHHHHHHAGRVTSSVSVCVCVCVRACVSLVLTHRVIS